MSGPARETHVPSLGPGVAARIALLGIIAAVHAGVWAIALTLSPGLVPTQQIVAETLSTSALVLVSVNLMLSTRAGPIERRLHGLDKLFVAHRTIGLSVAFFVSAHFLIVPKSLGYVPSKPVGYTTLPLLLIAILAASAPRFPWRRLVPLKYQTWKTTHRFMGVIVAMAVTHSLLAHTYVKQVPLLASYVYGVAALGLMAYLYRELLFARVGPFRAYDVERARRLGDDVTEVVLASPSPPLQRAAGQFAFASFERGPTREQHPFTISSGVNEPVRFSIKASGDFTGSLDVGKLADSAARIEGPYGAFTSSRGRTHQLWLAGGIGITPFLSMAEDLGGDTNVLLVWSVHDMREAIYAEELERDARNKPNLRVDIHPTSERGHLKVAEMALEAAPGEYSAFLCGPLPMRREMMRQLLSLGVPRREIYFEEFRLR
jgi:predicted ferric reductase